MNFCENNLFLHSGTDSLHQWSCIGNTLLGEARKITLAA